MHSSSTFAVRPIDHDDASALLYMMRELARFENQEYLLAATEESIRRDGFGATAQFSGFIALDGREPAGFVTYGNAYTTWGARQFILVDDLFVREAYRGRGVARQLMGTIEKLVLSRGTYARWTVSPGNERAIAFYKSLGARYVLKGQCYWHLDESGKATTAT
jgi:GNAT superfamily N-acetyltransferase